jgi:HEAT repeat protein
MRPEVSENCARGHKQPQRGPNRGGGGRILLLVPFGATNRRNADNPPVNGERQFLTIAAEPDEDRWWELVSGWVTADPSGARLAAEGNLDSDDASSREAAADILGQVSTVDRAAAAEIADLLLPRLNTEQEPGVLQSLIVGLGHTSDLRIRPEVARLADHRDEDVRLAVAWALAVPDADDHLSLNVLRRLSTDPDENVRDWATFGLAQSDATDPATIEAMAARADDPDDGARTEAIFGLARRKDPRARALIDRELARPDHDSLIEEAVEELEAG